MRTAALGVILVRAGLSLDVAAVYRLRWPASRLAFAPSTAEALTVALLAKPALDLSVYAITDARLHAKHGHQVADAVAAAIRGGATIIQLREKELESRAFAELAAQCVAAAAGSGVPVLINDRVDIALASGAAGVHLGQGDLDAATARREHATIRRCISLWLDGGGRGSVHVGVYTLRSQIINVIAKHGSREYFARCERAVDDVERARRGFFAVVEQRRSFAVT